MARLLPALIASTALLPAAAHAQSTAPAPADRVTGTSPADIVVTAQRHEQRLQDVPLSVSAIAGSEIRARGVTDLKDLEYSVPSLSTFEYGVGQQVVQLRGIATTSGSSTVGLYLDETPLGLDTQGNPLNVRLYDMERVEVLRGPQATLYGQGSMGGTIRYIPAAPQLDRVSGSFDGEFSSTKGGGDNGKAVAVLNQPIVKDVVGVRLVAGYERIGGYIDNVVTGEKDINSANIYTVRGTLLAKPTDRLSLSLMGDFQESRQASQDFGIDYKTKANFRQPLNDRYGLFQAKASYDLDFAELSASGSYITHRNASVSDVSTKYAVIEAIYGLPIEPTALPIIAHDDIYNGEVRLASKNDGPFGWQLGALYRDAKIHSVSSTATVSGALPLVFSDTDVRQKNASYAVYGELSYAFTPKLKAIAGLRYFSEHKTSNIASVALGTSSLDLGDKTFHSVNPRFNLSYAFTPHSMVYANIAKGFRSGGFNVTSIGEGIPPTYNSDTIWTYEVGTKHELFDSRLILDASVYRNQWSGVQSYTFVPGTAFAAVTNGGHVQGWGVDLAATARPTKALTLTATYSWNNMAYTTTTIDKAAGDPVDGAVRKSWSASLDYRPPLTETISGVFRIDYQHAGPSQITLRNFQVPPVVERPRRNLVNLRIGADIGSTEIAVFADNLLNETAPSLIGPLGNISEDIEQRPRVIGVSLGTKF